MAFFVCSFRGRAEDDRLSGFTPSLTRHSVSYATGRINLFVVENVFEKQKKKGKMSVLNWGKKNRLITGQREATASQKV